MCTDSQTRAAGGGKWVLDETAFERLLAWLDPVRERAGQRYEDIRLRLIKIFTCRGCHESEDLADETINRVARKLEEVAETYEGDRALYFYGVAHKVYLEYLRKRPARVAVLPPPAPPERSEKERAADEREYECLERCMSRLPAGNRDLVLEYYREEKREKIEHRKLLAAQLGIGLNALRIRACRIRETLYRCVQACLGEGAAG
jgi:DNA-directed RNA polymerase specialized sigma24 family protein